MDSRARCLRRTNGFNYMVNLGIPDARRYITDLVSGLIEESGIFCYRQSFNDLRVPEPYAMSDAPDRAGITEIGHITRLHTFWDELLARHPGLIIDNCTGGGQRIDLETKARSVPLWRSDLQSWPFGPMSMQTQSRGFAPRMPLSAAVCDAPTRYAFRCALAPAITTHWSFQALEQGRELPFAAIREWMEEALTVRKYFYGEFYPLLSFSLANDARAAWLYDRPDLGEGMLRSFRRDASPFSRWEAMLRALSADALYEIRSWDGRETLRMSGLELTENGLPVTITERPEPLLFTYRKIG